MKYLVLILLSLSIAAGLAVLAVNDTGMVLVSIYDWTIQASLFFIIACLVILFTFLYIGIRLLARLVSLPRDYSAWQHHRRREKSGKYLDRGLLALVEGRWKDAEQALIKGAGYSDSPLIYYLCAARAAQR